MHVGAAKHVEPFHDCPTGQDAVMLAARLIDPPLPEATAVHVIAPFQFAVPALDPPEAGLSAPDAPLLHENVTDDVFVEFQ